MKRQGMLALLRYPDFPKLWLARVISRFGDSIDAIAFMWLIYQLTGSGTLMGLIMAVNFTPNLVFGLLGGVIADRKSKKKTMLLGDLGRGTIVTITALLFAMGWLRVWHLFVFTFLNSTLEAFTSPARTSTLPLLITNKEDILAANSLFSASSSMAEILGLGIAGTIIGHFGVAAAMLVDAATFFIAAFSISLITIPNSQSEAKKLAWADFKHDFREGVSLAFGNKLIRLCIFMGATLNAFVSPFSILAPIFSDQILHAGAQGLGNMNLALTSAMLLGSILFGQFGQRLSHRQRLFIGFLGMGSGFLIIFSLRSLAFAILGSFCIGLGVSVLSSAVATIVMTGCQQELLGRVSSVMNGTMMAAMPASSALAGVVVESLGPVVMIGAIGILVLLTGAVTVASPELRQASTNSPSVAAEAGQ